MSDMIEKLNIYKENLLEWNKVMNLTAITDSSDIDTLHFADCISLAGIYDLSGKSVIDVGTGAGFPGLPLKINDDSIELTLLDSLDKRLNFLRDTCEKLGIGDVKLVHSRAEEIPAGMREAFDVATSRAVARLNVLAELCLPYVKEGGVFIAMKGPDFDDELDEAKPSIKALGGKCEKCVTYMVPGTGISHSAIIIRKLSSTPTQYPRRWSQIKSKPIA